MIGLYFFFKMMYVLVVASAWILIGTVYALFWLGYGAILAAVFITRGIIWLIAFIVLGVKEIRRNRQERQLAHA